MLARAYEPPLQLHKQAFVDDVNQLSEIDPMGTLVDWHHAIDQSLLRVRVHFSRVCRGHQATSERWPGEDLPKFRSGCSARALLRSYRFIEQLDREPIEEARNRPTANTQQTQTASDTNDMVSTTRPVTKCPGCTKTSLSKLLRQQGAGGWKSWSTHLSKCQLSLSRARTLTPTVDQQFTQLLELANLQCAANDKCKEARKAAQPERRAAAAQKAEVPWFVQQQRKEQAPPTAAPPVCCVSCNRCFAATDAISFEQHSAHCADKRAAQLKHHEIKCEVTAEKAKVAQQRVEAVQKTVEKAKNALNKKQAAIEEEKRRKRVQQGKKKKNKKHAYSASTIENTEEEDAENQCTIQGCMQRLKEAEKTAREARQRATFREQTAEIARDEAEGVENPLVAKRAVQAKHQKYEKKIKTFRNEQKRKSKETLSKEKTEKSKDKSKRRTTGGSHWNNDFW